MTLTEQLATANAAGRAKIPAQYLEIMDGATDELVKAEIEARAPKAGTTFTNFALPNSKGETVTFNDVLEGKDFAVISFYRGGWCPYCNIELKALQEALPQIEAHNATLVAITPETPDNSLSTSERNNLAFPVLTDENNEFARKLGIVFTMPKNLQEVYSGFGLDVAKYNGNDAFELPLPGTFVVDAKGTILYAFAPADYTKRLDTVKILQVLEAAKTTA